MTRYVILDQTGFAWGVCDADCPIEAAKIADQDFAGERAKSWFYQIVDTAQEIGGHGRVVREAPTGWPYGKRLGRLHQNPALIRAAGAFPRAAYVRVSKKKPRERKHRGA